MASASGNNDKRHHSGEEGVSIEKLLPEHILSQVLQKLELESLCTAACVSTTFHSAVTHLLSSLSSLDLSGFSLDDESLKHVAHRVQGAKRLTIDCLQVKNDSSIINILHENIIDLTLLKCSSLSYDILRTIGERVFLIEFAGRELPELFKRKLIEMLQKFSLLESLSIKIRGTVLDVFDLQSLELFLPKSVKNLKLQPTNEHSSIHWIDKLRDVPWVKLLSLSLVVDIISDALLITVANSLPLLVELDLEDRPCMEPSMRFDLTNTGLQCLGVSRHLITLSIVRSRIYYPASFKRVNNLGMFLLSESCGGLESVKLGGFTKVTEGFSSILHSCQNLKKFEVLNSSLLSDLAFHNMRGVARSLIELRLLSCRLLTSEAMEELSSFSNLEVLDTSGCRSIADPCLSYISSLTTLTTLNLAEADITDSGLAVLGRGNLPIARLCISGCKRVTDKGIGFLFHGEGKICRTLLSLDVGNMPGITDAAIFTIASAANALTDLCLRYCFHVTDAAMKMLVDRPNQRSSPLQRLDLFNCRSLTDDLIMLLLHKSSFRGLRWLGVGFTPLVNKRDDFSTICNVRPWLIVCFDGCELGCHDGWQFHQFDEYYSMH